MKLDALLRTHGFRKIERPPQIWEAETDDERFIPLLGEMIAASLTRGAKLDWEADAVWRPDEAWNVPWLAGLTDRLKPAGARYAYIRKSPSGSITVFIPRSAAGT